ncbi:hypothetical protein LJR220_004719 [Bradyrhizobium sp. LjRoot220]|uniref:hypothetical protein n=1 Tax=Bradyrhizobium sp. LjRoot220 TaxID=3342284 RepID=UPI003ECDDCAB
MLDVLDKELEKRGHRFVRYADDCNIYVRSQRARAVMTGIERFLAKRLRLKVNKARVRSPNRASASSWALALPMEAGRRRLLIPLKESEN